MKTFTILFSFIFLSIFSFAQDSDLYKEVIEELAGKKYFGRAYYKAGDLKAANYIKETFESVGAKPYKDNYFQEFSFPVNVFHGAMKMSVDGKKLMPAKDFVMREFSSGIKGEYELYYVDTIDFDAEKLLDDLNKEENMNSLLVFDFHFFHAHGEELRSLYKSDIPGMILSWTEPLKFYKAYSSFALPMSIIWVSSDFPKNASSVKFDIDNKMIENHITNNVIGFVEGSRAVDSFFVFTAHYDHIGMMGKKTLFPGANDNASGVAMLISLAEHYSKPENKPECSMLFLAVAGEETGLLGSKHFAENPLVSLDKIKYVINFDMIADNSKDIYCEISDPAVKGFELFNSINEEHSYFEKLDQGVLAGNSDHYSFAEKDVPAICFLMKGDYFAIYHTPADNNDNIDLTNFPKLYKMVCEFVEKY